MRRWTRPSTCSPSERIELGLHARSGPVLLGAVPGKRQLGGAKVLSTTMLGSQGAWFFDSLAGLRQLTILSVGTPGHRLLDEAAAGLWRDDGDGARHRRRVLGLGGREANGIG